MKNKLTVIDIAKLTLPYKKSIIILSLIMIAHSSVLLINPYLMKIVFDEALGKSNINLLWYLLAIFLTVKIVEAVLGILLNVQLTKIGTKILLDLRHDILGKVFKQDISFFKINSVGTILFRLHDQMLVLFRAVGNFSVNIIARTLLVLGIVIVLFCMNPKLALLSLLLIPIYYYIVSISATRIQNANRLVMEGLSSIVDYITETISAILTIRLYSKEKYFLKRHEEKTLEFNDKTIKITWITSIWADLLDVVSYIAPIFILCLGGMLYIKKEVTLGQLISFYTYVGLLFVLIKDICDMINGVQGSLVALEQINEYKNISSSEERNNKIVEKIDKFEKIEFKNIYYSYDGQKDVLANSNFVIRRGETVAFVGSSGSGKTTIINLILGIITPQKGNILINDIPYDTIDIQDIRNMFAVVPQDVFLFNDTIKENVCFGSAVSEEKIKEIFLTADIYNDVAKLPNTFNYIVGARGDKLSGGQKQRIAIARALFKNSDVLVLDEATSNIDSESERIIQESIINVLDKCESNKTKIIITHRLSTVKHADRIIYLEDGKIVESGTYKELVKNKKQFYKLFSSQTN